MTAEQAVELYRHASAAKRERDRAELAEIARAFQADEMPHSTEVGRKSASLNRARSKGHDAAWMARLRETCATARTIKDVAAAMDTSLATVRRWIRQANVPMPNCRTTHQQKPWGSGRRCSGRS